MTADRQKQTQSDRTDTRMAAIASATSRYAMFTLISMLSPVASAFAPPTAHQRARLPWKTGATAMPSQGSALFPLAESLTAEQEHAREVFEFVDKDHSNCINEIELCEMLRMLDIDASESDAEALFRYLDADGEGSIGFDEFLPWYSDAANASKESASTFQGIISSRRTVHKFDQTPVSDDVLTNAVRCAISAPNRSGSEPWRFIRLGPRTVEKIAKLNKDMGGNEGSFTRWTSIPGWCVVTCTVSPDDPDAEQEDFKSTCCAVENFMLSMWSEGIGTKWTTGPVQRTSEFAKLCGIDVDVEKVAGVIWYGFASGGLVNAAPKYRRKGVDDVLSSVP